MLLVLGPWSFRLGRTGWEALRISRHKSPTTQGNKTVMNSASETAEPKRRRLSRAAQIEGYLSLPIVVLGFLNPIFAAIPETFRMPIGITMWACAWLFAISGIRHGKDGARVVAGFALVILVVELLWLLTPRLHGSQL
jgi:hypothetical protein